MIGEINIQHKFHVHCASADASQVNAFLSQQQVDVNFDNGLPLILAIRSIQKYPQPSEDKCLKTMELLVKAGADVNIDEDAPLYWALKVKNAVAVDYLISLQKDFSADPELIEDFLSENRNLSSQTTDFLEKLKTNSASKLSIR